MYGWILAKVGSVNGKISTINRDFSANRSFNRRDAPNAKGSHRQSGILKEGRRLIYKDLFLSLDQVLHLDLPDGRRGTGLDEIIGVIRNPFPVRR